MVKIRLSRLGAHKRPYYRFVVVNSKAKRDGTFIEVLGTYDPLKEPSEIKLDLDKTRLWLQRGAQPTEGTKKLLQRVGIDS